MRASHTACRTSAIGSEFTSGRRPPRPPAAVCVGRGRACAARVGGEPAGVGRRPGARVAGLVPGSAAALDQQILGFEGGARENIGQIGKPQMHRRDLRERQISLAKRRGDGDETRRDPRRGGLAAISLAE